MKYKVYIITGAPGVGKSTIAEKLRELYPHSFFIDIDVFRKQVGKVDMNLHDQDYLKTLDIVANNVRFLLENDLYLPIFVFDCLSPKNIDSFVEAIGNKGEIKQIVLWMGNDLLKERITSRVGHFYYDFENAKKMNDWFFEYRDTKHDDFLFLDRSEFDVEKTVERIVMEVM